MMGQRKLTDSESHWIGLAASAIESLMVGCRCLHPWDKRFADLLAVAYHGTTDGNPYVEPQPEIGEGYRLATEADSARLDLEVMLDRWTKTGPGLCNGFIYRVPVDRIPTDEDAVGRPVVMVKGHGDDEAWQPGKLIEVDSGSPHEPFYVRTDLYKESFWWDRCRFPYPGELP